MAQKKDKKTGKFKQQDLRSTVAGFRTRGKSPIIHVRFYDANGVPREWSTGTSSVKDARAKAQEYIKTTSEKAKGSSTNPIIRADRKAEAIKYLKKSKKSTKGTATQIIDRANDLKWEVRNKDAPHTKLGRYLSTTKQQRRSGDIRSRASTLHKQLLTDQSLATNPDFIKKVDALRIVKTKNPKENRYAKSARRRETVIRQTPKWAIENPGFRTELKQFGYSGRSQQRAPLQKMFPGKFHSDHIHRIASGGLNAPHNLQLLTVEQHKQKTALENRGQLEKARNLFKFNPYNLRPELRGLLAENVTQRPAGRSSIGGGGGMGIMDFKTGSLNFSPYRRPRKLY